MSDRRAPVSDLHSVPADAETEPAPRKRRLHLTLNPAVVRWLRREAADRDCTVSEVVEKSVDSLRAAGMPSQEAEKVEETASHLPDWSQVATKSDLSELKDALIRWMVVFTAVVVLLIGSSIALSFLL